MKLFLIAVGQRIPTWAEAGYMEYAKRFPPECRLELKTVKAEPRQGGKTAMQLMKAEAQRIEALIAKESYRVILDEKGTQRNTPELAERLEVWLGGGRDISLIVGGADGLDDEFKKSADETLKLSSLTLPHALVRVVMAEALYRAWTLLNHHPYHRE